MQRRMPIGFAMRPAPPPAVGGLEISQFRGRVVPHMHGVTDSERSQPISRDDEPNVAFRLS